MASVKAMQSRRRRTARESIKVDPDSIRIVDDIDTDLDEPIDDGPPSVREFAKATADGLRDLQAEQTPKIGSTWSQEDVDNLTFLATMLALFAGARLSYWAIKDPALTPDEETAAEFSEPLARIISRHWKIGKAVKGDMGDVFRMSGAVLGYLIQVFDVRDERMVNERRTLNRMHDGPKPENAPVEPHERPTMRTVAEGFVYRRNDGGPTWNGDRPSVEPKSNGDSPAAVDGIGYRKRDGKTWNESQDIANGN